MLYQTNALKNFCFTDSPLDREQKKQGNQAASCPTGKVAATGQTERPSGHCAGGRLGYCRKGQPHRFDDCTDGPTLL